MLKNQLRKIYLNRRNSLTDFERENKNNLIAKFFFETFDLLEIKFLHSFLPIEKFGEIDTMLILKKTWRDFPHIITLVPRVDFQKGEIENVKFSTATATKKNVWQIDEPQHDETIDAAKIDLVLVPLLCVDERGFRVGYGKGFYDKLLKNCRADCRKVGLNYFPPIKKISDVDAFDIKLDVCVTPERIFDFTD